MSQLPTPGTYQVDPVHSSVEFVARHLIGAKVRGRFTEFSGTITIGDTPETSSVEATAQVHSITTGNEMRDGHLQSPDFLEQSTYPTITLKSTKVTPTGENTYELLADLTIHGVTHSVPFELEYLGTGPGMAPDTVVAGFEAKAEIDRRDFDVKFNRVLDSGAIAVGNKVTLEINVEATAPATAPAQA